MEKNQKMLVGVIAAIVLVGLIGVFVFSQQTGIALNISNNTSTAQGNSGQSSGNNGGSQSSSQGSGSSSGSSDSGSGGAQYKNCPTCSGTGTVTEKVNFETCPRCQGSGIDPNSLRINPVSCSKCGGSGVIAIPSGKTVTETCPTCGGSGKVQA